MPTRITICELVARTNEINQEYLVEFAKVLTESVAADTNVIEPVCDRAKVLQIISVAPPVAEAKLDKGRKL